MVLVIVALAASAVSLSLDALAGRDAERAVARLRLVLEASAERAAVRGQPLALEFIADGYRFTAFHSDGSWRPLHDPPVFAERLWPPGVSVAALRVAGEDRAADARLVFGSATPAFELRLATPSGPVLLRGDAAGGVERVAAPSPAAAGG